MNLKKITLLIATLTISIGITSPNISVISDPYFNGSDNIKQKDIIVKPLDIQLDAEAWVTMNYHTGDIISKKNMNVKREPASLTKIMTSYIVASEIENGNLTWDTMVPISHKSASTGGSKMYLRAGSQVSVKNLVKGMDIVSGNDATIALAEYIGGNTKVFTNIMNQNAIAIGMNNTNFINPDGLPEGSQYTTAHDMAILARSYIYNFPEAYKVYSQKGLIWNATKQDSVDIVERKKCLPKFDRSNGEVMKSYTANELDDDSKNKCIKLFPKNNNFVLQNNRNKLIFTFDGVDGLKTGQTSEAGYCLVASSKQEGERFISVVLGANSAAKRDSESAKILRYALTKYKNVLLYKSNSPIIISANNIPNASIGQKITVSSNQNIYKTVPKNYIPHLKQGIEFNPGIKAPITKGQIIGNLIVTVSSSKEKIASIPVVAQNNISQKSWW